jgi:epidermal growth factor receptor substrate 15
MYLIQACMSGQLPFVPTSLPPGLYEQASGKPLDGVAVHSTGSSSAAGPGLAGSFTSRVMSSPIQPQYTGSRSLQPQTTGSASRFAAPPPILPSRPSGQSTTSAFTRPQSAGPAPQWDVTPAEKANADRFFDQLDTSKRGFIEGDVAVPFMLQSKLSEDILAQIWYVFSFKA